MNTPQGNNKIQIDPKLIHEIANEKCKICGCELWDQSIIMKIIPMVMSPTGREEAVQIPVTTCKNCLAPYGAEVNTETQKEN